MKTRNRWINIFFFLLAALIAGMITFRIAMDKIIFVDQWMEPYVNDINEQGWLFFAFRWITELGSATFLVPFSIIMAFSLWWLSRNWLITIFFAGGAIIGPYMNTVIKNLVQRERPRLLEVAEGVGYSFPSGHAMSSMVIYGMLIYFFSITIKKTVSAITLNIIFILLILLIGLSRYIIRVHHFSDVLAGFAYGFIFLFIWLALFRWIYWKKFHRKPSSPS